eukprot:TRINITY_DN3649_c0_g1_i1.p1 TRINITY_DN3649_c0_g1~~TRINITY_DN3649_c0_g1_i1.p1  ORF type:complete len:370 (-),score=88.53 TRINITY_DN3649_c0_g1_i1:92-1168(-)
MEWREVYPMARAARRERETNASSWTSSRHRKYNSAPSQFLDYALAAGGGIDLAAAAAAAVADELPPVARRHTPNTEADIRRLQLVLKEHFQKYAKSVWQEEGRKSRSPAERGCVYPRQRASDVATQTDEADLPLSPTAVRKKKDPFLTARVYGDRHRRCCSDSDKICGAGFGAGVGVGVGIGPGGVGVGIGVGPGGVGVGFGGGNFHGYPYSLPRPKHAYSSYYAQAQPVQGRAPPHHGRSRSESTHVMEMLLNAVKYERQTGSPRPFNGGSALREAAPPSFEPAPAAAPPLPSPPRPWGRSPPAYITESALDDLQEELDWLEQRAEDIKQELNFFRAPGEHGANPTVLRTHAFTSRA